MGKGKASLWTRPLVRSAIRLPRARLSNRIVLSLVAIATVIVAGVRVGPLVASLVPWK